MSKQMVLHGKYNSAIIYTNQVADNVKEQVTQLLNESFIEGERIAIMPDTHVGKGAVIGTTITTRNGKVSPNLVGVDIGCGILVTQLDVEHLDKRDFVKLDNVIHQHIPSGFNVNVKATRHDELDDLTFKLKKKNRMQQSLGSLGGGNHFIELSKDEDNKYYLTIHSGSRALGLAVSNHHQRIATDYCYPKGEEAKVKVKNLAYLEGKQLDDYLKDLYIAQAFAKRNREMMAERILRQMNWEMSDQFDSIHNYIDPENGILRKGATSAKEGQRLIIPLNMRDGAIIAVGKGNPDWNYSAPHGAGRILSRSQAKKELSYDYFKETMREVYSSSVKQATLDEAPMAYNAKEDILKYIDDTVSIEKVIKPVYNFKA